MGPDGLSLIRTRLKKINSIHKINESTTICQFKFFLNRDIPSMFKISGKKKKKKRKSKTLRSFFCLFPFIPTTKNKNKLDI
jgi:hypothetical protein